MANQQAPKDNNDVSAILLTSVVDGTTMRWLGDPVTGAALVEQTITGLTVGTTAVTGATNGYTLYNNNGVLGAQAGAAITIGAPVSGGTASQLLATDGSTNLQNLAVATYPSLTELSYVKGVTSGIQSQINGKTSNTGTVTTVSVTTANGVSGTVATATTTPAITLSLGAITPSTVNALTLASQATGFTIAGGTTSKTLTVPLDASVSGTNTGDNATNSTYTTLATTIATANTWTATQTEKAVVYSNNAITATANAATVPITYRLNTVTNNSAATLTITMTTTSAVDGQPTIVRILDSSAVAQTLTFVNTENSTVSVPTTSNGSTTLPVTVGFMYNNATSKWRCVAVA